MINNSGIGNEAGGRRVEIWAVRPRRPFVSWSSLLARGAGPTGRAGAFASFSFLKLIIFIHGKIDVKFTILTVFKCNFHGAKYIRSCCATVTSIRLQKFFIFPGRRWLGPGTETKKGRQSVSRSGGHWHWDTGTQPWPLWPSSPPSGPSALSLGMRCVPRMTSSV